MTSQKKFCFIYYARLTASNKGELSNHNAAYKINALEFIHLYRQIITSSQAFYFV